MMVEGMSMREASRMFDLHWDTVRKMLAYSRRRATGEKAHLGAPSSRPIPASSPAS